MKKDNNISSAAIKTPCFVSITGFQILCFGREDLWSCALSLLKIENPEIYLDFERHPEKYNIGVSLHKELNKECIIENKKEIKGIKKYYKEIDRRNKLRSKCSKTQQLGKSRKG